MHVYLLSLSKLQVVHLEAISWLCPYSISISQLCLRVRFKNVFVDVCGFSTIATPLHLQSGLCRLSSEFEDNDTLLPDCVLRSM
eukprot:m.887672 g.887672  ORF g.887672 m.887672 type:complete len:84 (+) comp23636_c0_seq30:1066-1317(+)